MRDADPVGASRSRRRWLLLLGEIIAGVLTLLLVPMAVNVWTGGSLPGHLARYNQDAGWAAAVLVAITVGLVAWLEARHRADSASVDLGELVRGGSQRDEELARVEERRERRVLLAQVRE